MQKWTLVGMSSCGFEVDMQFWSGTLLASLCDGEGSKQGAGLHFPFFFQVVFSVRSAFSSCPLGLAEWRVPLHKRNRTTTYWSEICLKTQVPRHMGELLSSSAQRKLVCSSAEV